MEDAKALATGLRWPDAQRWAAYLRFLALFLLFFLPVYAGGGWLAALWPDRVRHLSFDWERDIPLVPWMVWPYVSLYTVYALPLLHLDAPALRRLTQQSIAAVLVAGLAFVLLPGQVGYAPVLPDDVHGPLVRLILAVDTRANAWPSLHVACAALILLACAREVGGALRHAYLAWLALLAASTVLVHQHHLLDVVTGFALALVLRRVFPITPRDAGAP